MVLYLIKSNRPLLDLVFLFKLNTRRSAIFIAMAIENSLHWYKLLILETYEK